ncbi:methyltransferase domain-containing protein, partial [Streptomyces sp. SID5785]|uniref:class I SAM-dependent methyltransferase n=1 Tax=Streptomyces sp. SID5785 TaxID=2690309 RepID=UPI001360CA3B
MFSSQGPTLRELAVQALSSVEHGYDLLAPAFDHTPFRTPDAVLAPVTRALRRLGPYRTGLDLCCGTGAGLGVLREVCTGTTVGLDFSGGMLRVARDAEPAAAYVRGDALALPFGPVFDLAVSFGAFGHFLPAQQPAL